MANTQTGGGVNPEPQKPKGYQSGKSTRQRGQQRGAYCLTEHSERTVTIYPILETEMKSLGLLNTLATTLFSIGSALLTFCAGLYFNVIIEPTPPASATGQVQIVFWICIPLGVALVVGACAAAYYRHSELKRILSECKKVN